jgi:hypothetical protein
MAERLFDFCGGNSGSWRVVEMDTIAGEPLATVKALSVVAAATQRPQTASWLLRGITSNDRYVTRGEKDRLVAKQPSLGRAEATRAALIPIRKSNAWWALSQDDRRRIFEDQSAHISIGLKYLPAVARRLYHCRDLGAEEPFDFLTWFEFAPAHSDAFDELVAELRASAEWRYVDREIDIRLERDAAA